MAEVKKTFKWNIGDQMEKRAVEAASADKTFLYFHDEKTTFAEFFERSCRFANLLKARNEAASKSQTDSLHAAVMMDNCFEFAYAFGGCALAGGTLFGVNTGLRGKMLADVINHSKSNMLITDLGHFDRIVDIRDQLPNIPDGNIFVRIPEGESPDIPANMRPLQDGLADHGSTDRPDAKLEADTPLMIIYTSGTTGAPKGIINSHGKLLFIGQVGKGNLALKDSDIGYACMPLFHSNSIFLGFMPAFLSNSGMVLKERFSASGFLPDMLKYGVTFWNYVGQPVHYVILAIEREFGEDEAAIIEKVAEDPNNKLRVATGNGASPVDQEKFVKYFGLDDIFEGYGSTEMAIASVRRKGDPWGSVGRVLEATVKILDEGCNECPPAEYDENGKFLNYTKAVGEICKVDKNLLGFEGYYDDEAAMNKKIRDGIYHSGDLGHIRIIKNIRYLYFDGRTDDWIRKDGENFSAENVAKCMESYPPVESACAFGVPCEVSDEKVMVAVRVHDGESFDPKAFHNYLTEQSTSGDMDAKWMPDYVRVVEEFEHTRTEKILVRPLKHEYFNLKWVPEGAIYFRQRGDDTYKPFTQTDLDTLKEEFKKNERIQLLETWR